MFLKNIKYTHNKTYSIIKKNLNNKIEKNNKLSEKEVISLKSDNIIVTEDLNELNFIEKELNKY